jgi:hypothetical protein
MGGGDWKDSGYRGLIGRTEDIEDVSHARRSRSSADLCSRFLESPLEQNMLHLDNQKRYSTCGNSPSLLASEAASD